jgi:hypothetical protein
LERGFYPCSHGQPEVRSIHFDEAQQCYYNVPLNVGQWPVVRNEDKFLAMA